MPVGELERIFAEDNVAVVMDQGVVTGIVTKIDLIAHLGSQSR
jgi:predicted transcriptional regulator